MEDIVEQEEKIELQGIHWDKPFYTLDQHPLVPCVFEGDVDLHSLPKGFNTVTIRLDGKLKSDLNWKQAKTQAEAAIKNGFFVMWEMDLGLFSGLSHPLTHQSQYLSLILSIEHFRDSLWKEFSSSTIGLIVYKGTADFSTSFRWDETQIENLRAWLKDVFVTNECLQKDIGLSLTLETVLPTDLYRSSEGEQLVRLFCRNVAIEYISLLTNCLPDRLPRYLLLDASSITNPLYQAQLLHPDMFDLFALGLKGTVLPMQSLGWNHSSAYGYIGEEPLQEKNTQKPVIGVCLPSSHLCRPTHYQGLQQALCALIDKQISFRLIPEDQLITHWDGLDFLIYVPNGLSLQGKRKVLGFCAAGGVPVTAGAEIGLPDEISFADFIDKY